LEHAISFLLAESLLRRGLGGCCLHVLADATPGLIPWLRVMDGDLCVSVSEN
jgi:hypothetical protein